VQQPKQVGAKKVSRSSGEIVRAIPFVSRFRAYRFLLCDESNFDTAAREQACNKAFSLVSRSGFPLRRMVVT
jgi:hypothetical protein